jgi:hypothetical protein
MADERPPLSNPMAEALAEDAAIAAAKAAREAPAPEPAPEPVAAAPEPAAEAAPTEPEAPAPPADGEKAAKGNETALLKRIAKLAAEKKAQERELAAARALIEAGKRPEGETGTTPPAPAGGRLYTQDELEAAAANLAAQRAFNERANQSYLAGKEKFGDFETRMETLRETGFMSPQLLEAALESNAPADVLHYLGGNLGEAERISALSPIQMGVQLATLAQKVAAPKTARISNAPAPLTPVTGGASPTVDFSKLADSDDMKAWVAARAKAGDKWATGRG